MQRTKVIYKSNPLYKHCPSCSQIGSLRKSHARVFSEKIIKKFTYYGIYRCKECGWRGYLSNFTITSRSIKIFLLYAALFLISAFIVSRLLRYFI